MIAQLLDKALAGQRLTPNEGLQLLKSNDLAALGAAANAVSRRLHPENYRTYNIDRNINYTNICVSGCKFCAFFKTPNQEDDQGYIRNQNQGYIISKQELSQKVFNH